MSFDDAIYTAANLAIGFFLGLAAYALAGLFLNGAWLLAVGAIVPWVIWLLFYILLERVWERIFPSGAKHARKVAARRGKPLARKLSLPVGLVLGALAAWLGLTDTILGALT